MTKLLIWFGEWCVWREYPTREEAEQGLAYWQGRCSWPLKLDGDGSIVPRSVETKATSKGRTA
jgi:hypothetical protein